MRNNKIKLLLVYLITITIVSGCTPFDMTQVYVNTCHKRTCLAGKITENRYYAPNNIFNVQIPAAADEDYITDEYMEGPFGYACVSFSNEAGLYHAEMIMKALPEETPIFLSKNPEKKQMLLQLLFDDVFSQIVPEGDIEGHLLYKNQLVVVMGEPAIFAVFNFPKGSSCYIRSQNRIADANRGFLLWMHQNKYFFCISEQDCLSIYFNDDNIELLQKRLFLRLQDDQKKLVIPVDCFISENS